MTLRRRAQRALPETEGPTLVVATYNIHRCVGVDRRYDPARIAAVLREIDADVIGLQEVDARRGERNLDQWAYLSEATGMHAIVGANVLDHRGRFGNAILTRWPVVSSRLHDLSVPGLEPRGAIDADIAIGDRLLRVVATHFGLRDAERRMQTVRLLDALASDDDEEGENGGKRPDAILVMGDLNEWRGRRGGIRWLDGRLGRAPAPRTFPSWCPVLPLDKIYAAAPAVLCETRVHRSALARVASDHLPLCATMRWRAAGAAAAATVAPHDLEAELPPPRLVPAAAAVTLRGSVPTPSAGARGRRRS
jgi:endonuclease/exonuclease/phosphatase family metal-dependent hydrolase